MGGWSCESYLARYVNVKDDGGLANVLHHDEHTSFACCPLLTSFTGRLAQVHARTNPPRLPLLLPGAPRGFAQELLAIWARLRLVCPPSSTSPPSPPSSSPGRLFLLLHGHHTATMAPKNKAEVVESKTPAEFFSEHQSICGFDNVSLRVEGLVEEGGRMRRLLDVPSCSLYSTRRWRRPCFLGRCA